MNFSVTYVFLFSQSTAIDANQAVLFVRPYIIQELQKNNSEVATLLSVIENGAENITATFHDNPVSAVRMTFDVSVNATREKFAEQLVTSAVPVERTPAIRPFYCIGKTVEALV